MSFLKDLIGGLGRAMTPANPNGGWAPIIGGLSDAGGDTETAAGSNSNVLTCVNILADDVAKLPIHTYKAGIKEDGMQHRVAELLYTRANPYMTAFVFKRTMQYNLSMYGNAYAIIDYDEAGRPCALWPIASARVTPYLETDENGAQSLVYNVAGLDGRISKLAPENLIHLREPSAGGLVGRPLWYALVDEIKAQEEMRRFTRSFYENGTTVSGILKTPTVISSEAKRALRAEFMKVHGGAGNAHQVAVLDAGLDYTPIGMPLDSAQFLETKKFGIIEVAKVYKIPPYKLGQLDKASYSNTEAMALEYIKTALLPIFTQWEQEINTKLFLPSERAAGYYVKFNAAAELRGDSTKRALYYREMLNAGVYSINEVREMEERPTLGESGDKHFISLNYTTLDALEAYQLGKVGASPTDDSTNDDGKGGETDDGQTTD